MVKTFRLDEFGYEVKFDMVARQADGAAWFQQGGTIVLSTVVSASSSEFPGFLPLTVDYRELFSAAGKIPGGYFKREGKITDREVLVARLIDRSIRPLFPADYFKQIQAISTVYSVDQECAPHNLALIATSLALTVSKIPFLGPIGVVEVGRINGEWIINPTYPQSLESDVRLIIAGTAEGVTMVEGSGNEILEQDFVDVMFRAHDAVKKIVAWQESIAREIAVAKEALDDQFQLAAWKVKANAFITDDRVKDVYKEDKVVRSAYLDALKAEFAINHDKEIEANKIPSKIIDYVFDAVLKNKITELIFALNKRVDGRSFDQIRKISVEVGLLPKTHGSALFTRGRTQALVSVTLGGGQDAQRLESVMDKTLDDGSFMLQYNFPPFSVGEVRGLRAPSRRETGHGYLAASSFRFLLPSKDEFPYTIRVVADMFESDGSTSMATACGTTLALLNAGAPLTKMVAGVAMGLLKSEQRNEFQVLSDISGFEDQFGLMDFKVVGTDTGVTAIQMDIKYKGGLEKRVFEMALAQARDGRLFILGEMRKVINKPAPLSDLVPKVITVKIDTEKIGAIIGTGGKTIREITETTGTKIDIEQDGLVKIYGDASAQIDRAVRWVKTLAGQVTIDDEYEGKIRRVVEFGCFVELVPGFDGLVHVSNMPRDLKSECKVGQIAVVQVISYDAATGKVSLRLIKLKKQD